MIDEYRIEIDKLIDRVMKIVKMIDNRCITRSHQRTWQKIENIAIKLSIETQDYKDNIEKLDKENKNHLKKNLNIRRMAHDNQFKMCSLK